MNITHKAKITKIVRIFMFIFLGAISKSSLQANDISAQQKLKIVDLVELQNHKKIIELVSNVGIAINEILHSDITSQERQLMHKINCLFDQVLITRLSTLNHKSNQMLKNILSDRAVKSVQKISKEIS